MSAPTTALLFDGDCAFCSSSARWAQRWARSERAEVVAWQQVDLTPYALTSAQCSDALQWVDGGRRAAGPEAIAAYLRTARGAWPLMGRLLDLAPVRRVAWPVYRWIADNRHRLPGGTPQCSLPPARLGTDPPDSSGTDPATTDSPSRDGEGRA